MLSTLRFEPLRQERLSEVLVIENRVNSAPWSEKSFQNEIQHPQGIFVTALVDGKVAGYGGIWTVIDEAHVTTLAVDPDRQRQRIGQKMLVELLQQARNQGMTCATLEVRAGNKAAIALYEKLGFVIAAKRKGYYPDNKEDAVVMWLYDLTGWTPPA